MRVRELKRDATVNIVYRGIFLRRNPDLYRCTGGRRSRGFIEIKRNFIRRMRNFRYGANCVVGLYFSERPSQKRSAIVFRGLSYRYGLNYPRISYFEIRNYFQIIRPPLSSIASFNNWAIARTRTFVESLAASRHGNRSRSFVEHSRSLIRVRIITILKIAATFRSPRSKCTVKVW